MTKNEAMEKGLQRLMSKFPYSTFMLLSQLAKVVEQLPDGASFSITYYAPNSRRLWVTEETMKICTNLPHSALHSAAFIPNPEYKS